MFNRTKINANYKSCVPIGQREPTSVGALNRIYKLKDVPSLGQMEYKRVGSLKYYACHGSLPHPYPLFDERDGH